MFSFSTKISILLQRFFAIFCDFFAFTKICKELKLQKETMAQIEQIWFQISASIFSLKSPGQSLLWRFYQVFCS